MKRIFIVLLMIFTMLYVGAVFTGCNSQADIVSNNISQEADNFNVIRRLVVINARTDKPLIEIVGAFSFTLETNRIIVVVETGPNQYKKHSVGINEWTLWDIEDLSGANVSKYHYEVNFLPEMIIPVKLTNKD
jgi:hypothetical protein